MADNTIRTAVYGLPGIELEGLVSTIATVPIRPGMVLWLHTDGRWREHHLTDLFTGKHFCTENILAGQDITNQYLAGDQIKIYKGRGGDVFNLLLAPNSIATIGWPCLSAGTGYVYPTAVVPAADESVVGIFLEAKTTGPADTNTRIKVEIA